jgi:hypothetical protein
VYLDFRNVECNYSCNVRHLESLDVGQGVCLQDLLHVGLGVHQDKRQLRAQLAPDRPQEELDLGPMLLFKKIFSPKKLAKKLAILAQNKAK